MTDRLAAHYSDAALLETRQELHERFSEYDGDVRRWVTNQVPFEPGSELLDIGCGNGRYFSHYADRQARVVGLDPFPGMLRAAARSGHADLVAGRAEALPFAGKSFDVVFLNHMLGFAADSVLVLREARRVARDGGTVVVTLNTREHSRELYEVWNEAVTATGRTPSAAVKTAAYRAEDAVPDVVETFGNATTTRLNNAFVFTDPQNPVDYLATTYFAREEEPPLTENETRDIEVAVRTHAAQEIARHGRWRVPKPVMVIIATK
jgi:ubiquinone/menaquinone biosynthesis C-methylase UbiE